MQVKPTNIPTNTSGMKVALATHWECVEGGEEGSEGGPGKAKQELDCQTTGPRVGPSIRLMYTPT